MYLRFRFSLTTINPLEIAGLGKILHIFAASIGVLKMLPLILENSPFPCIFTIFLKKLSWKLGLFLIILNYLTHRV